MNFTRWDALKVVALLLMFIDHAGAFFYVDQEWLRGIGRACAPIFLFLAGFAPRYRHDTEIAAWAALLTANDWLVAGPNTLNILWSILLARMVLEMLENAGRQKLRLHEWLIGSIPFIFLLPFLQYGPFALLFALSGYVFKHRFHYKARTPLYFLIAVTVFYGLAFSYLSHFEWLTILVMAPSLALMCWLLIWFTRSPLASVHVPAPRLLKECARKTAPIYVVHLMLLGWITGRAL